MKIYRIDVWGRADMPKAYDGVSAVEQRLYFLQGDLQDADIARLCAEILVDPVTEEAHFCLVGSVDSDVMAHTVEVTLLPGVTDPPADNLVRAAHLLGITGLTRAATGQRYVIDGDVTHDQLQTLATQRFANPVIQRFAINAPIDAPFVPVQHENDLVESILLKDADDDGLMQISKERRLSLDLSEMRAIRDYYQETDREPTDAELEMLAQTWSEHCVHKTFKAKVTYTGPAHGAPADSEPVTVEIDSILNTYIRAATEKVNKDWVISAFVDNAGIIRFDEHWDIAFKVETHNRPSAIEPFGGANTGSGGVIRDVLGVSARPIANTNILCFGPPDLPEEQLPDGVLHPRRVAEGVVAGIEDYGNKMGIPTVSGAIHYHPGYTSNPLVFAGCLGILPHGSHPTEAKPGDLIVVIGGRTGRDGLRGATFSSMEMDTTTSTVSGGAVQIGNPIQEKQVQEVVLRARDERLYNAITDCGAGGLSSAVGEMGEKIGATVQLETVPLKYPGLQPWEIWLSEAQERMVLAVPPENWARLQEICAGQDVEATAIGVYEPTGRLTLTYKGKFVGDIAMTFLHDGIPQKHLKAHWSPPDAAEAPAIEGEDYGETLLKLLAMPTIRSKEDVIRRYDHEVQTGTAVKPLVGVHDTGPSDAVVIVPLDTIPLTPKSPLPQGERGLEPLGVGAVETKRLPISLELERKMHEVARRLRREATSDEAILWEQLRGRKLDGHKFRRQHPVGPFVLDFFCAEERLAVEVDGPIHEAQREDDALRQELIEAVGIRVVRVTNAEVEVNISSVLTKIRAALTIGEAKLSSSSSPSPHEGEGDTNQRFVGGEGVKGIALSVGMCPQYTELDPYAMAWAAIDEAIRNLVAVGADPDQIAILDNFSWGNTNLPDRMGELVRCAQGCYDAAIAYGVPFISGKDSLNNEYLGADGERHAIPGTLVISAVGIVPDVSKTVTMDLKERGNLLYVIGETGDEMGGSHYNELHGIDGGTVPQPSHDAMQIYRALHQAIQQGLVRSCHDVSEGGLAVALAEMCVAGGLSASYNIASKASRRLDNSELFGEGGSRLILEVAWTDKVKFNALVQATEIGHTDNHHNVPELFDHSLIFHQDLSTQFSPSFANVMTLERAWRGHVDGESTGAQHAAPPQMGGKTDTSRTTSMRTAPPKVLILHANGTNRDRDAVLACELAGGDPEIVHVNQLIRGERDLLDYHMLVVPGGFSYGDDLGAGVLWAVDLRERLPAIDRFVADGRPVLGICNGFQTLVKAGLIPGGEWDDEPGRPVTLTYNERGQFECRWVYLQPNSVSPCMFTEGLTEPIHCPVAHGEGRVLVRDEATLKRLWDDNLAALVYVDAEGNPGGYPVNPNGSAYNIAGLCNPAGNVFGLMPHPENHVFPWQHPRHRRGQQGMDGLRLFQNGIKFA